MSAWAGIEEFVAVAQTRSFSQAAKRLRCSASQVSRSVAGLEDQLGQRLFYRTTRHVSLTEVGERFLVRCRRLLDERDEALASVLEESERVKGHLRMTCAVAYGERFIIPHLNELMMSNPGLSVYVVLTDDVLDIVELGLDLAIRFGRLRDSRLITSRLTSRTRRLCAAPDYLERAGWPQVLEDLAQHECLKGAVDTWTFTRDGGTVTHRPQGRFSCNSGTAVVAAALRGVGLCWLPDFYVRSHLLTGELVELFPEHRPEDEGVWAVYPNRRYLPAKVKAVVEHLVRGLN